VEQQHPTVPIDLPLDKPSVVAVLVRELAVLYAQGMALGDSAPLDVLGLHRPTTFDPSTREWGVGMRGDHHYSLVVSNQGDVDWKLFPDLLAIAHSHPRDLAFVHATDDGPNLQNDVRFSHGIQVTNLLNELLALGVNAVVDHARAMTHLMPSNQDVRANYRTGGEYGQEELLFVPYRYDVTAGTMSLIAPNPAIVVHFGPALGVRQTVLPTPLRGYSDIVSQFISPIRIGYGVPSKPTLLWKGWLQCGWGDASAGMTLAGNQPPMFANAKSRKEIEAEVKLMGIKIPDHITP
jgi:hypothetical protein